MKSSPKNLCQKKYAVILQKKARSEQDLNLRGETPLDFKSNALTTRPSLHLWI